ncbi:hypothetical protein BRM1_06740 [Brevibacterium sp. BRM-1]|uniref:hypothetical protein n=1 Tax=Brevibacterium sp. BRM-1 TaxID=2999062 RepID=UPI00227E9D20|nr:hypothetical protein [Brevibacterium sp. BRM-1]WAL41527.1 hypothetical protein BRM1_06740 [Brevibacterium sp. BRM-1]
MPSDRALGTPRSAAAPAGYAPAAYAPAGQRPAARPAADRSALYPNILLGVACLFVLAAAIVFASIARSPGIRAVCIWAVALVVYGTGLLIYTLTRRLRPVGSALTGLGLALVPIAGSLLGGLSLTSPSLAWFVSSLVGFACFVLAAWLLRSATITWFAGLFCLSLFMSAASLTAAPVVWYFVVLILATSLLALAARVLRGRASALTTEPLVLIGEVVAPAAVVAATAIMPFPSAGAWAGLFGALAVHYAVAALLFPAMWRIAAAQAAAIAALVALVVACSGALWFHGHEGFAGRTGAGAVTALIAAVAVGAEAVLVRRRNRLFSLLCLGTGGVLLIAAHFAAEGMLRADVPALAIALALACASATGCALLIALAFDLPPAQGVAAACALGAVAWVGRLLPLSPSLPGGGARWVLVAAAGFTIVLAGVIAVQTFAASRAGRRLPRTRRAIPWMSGGAPFVLLLPAAIAPDAGMPLVAAAIALALLLALAGCACAAKSGLLLTGAMPLSFALGSGIARALGPASEAPARTALITAVVLTLITAGLVLAAAPLVRRGRAQRALSCATAAMLCTAGAQPMLLSGLAMSLISARTQLAPSEAVLAGAGIVAVLGAARWVQRRVLTTAPATVAIPGAVKRPAAPRQPGAPAARRPEPAPPAGWGPRPRLAGATGYTTAFSLGIGALAGAAVVVFGSSAAALPLAVVACGVVVAISAATALGERLGGLFALGGLPLLIMFTLPAQLITDDGSVQLLVGAWGAWAVTYGAYWLLVRLGRPSLTLLIMAFCAVGIAVLATLTLSASVPWLHSLPQAAAGLTVMAPALMLALLGVRMRSPMARRVLPEAASYVMAFGAMLVVHGIVDVRAVIGWHLVVAVAWFWGLRAEPRGERTGALVRLIVPFAALTLLGLVAALAGGGWYTVVFLADHVALLVYGALRSRPWALWWGLAASVAAIVWFLRDLVWLALIVLALVLIGVVVWLLLRGQRKPQPQSPPAFDPGPQSDGTGGGTGGPHGGAAHWGAQARRDAAAATGGARQDPHTRWAPRPAGAPAPGFRPPAPAPRGPGGAVPGGDRGQQQGPPAGMAPSGAGDPREPRRPSAGPPEIPPGPLAGPVSGRPGEWANPPQHPQTAGHHGATPPTPPPAPPQAGDPRLAGGRAPAPYRTDHREQAGPGPRPQGMDPRRGLVHDDGQPNPGARPAPADPGAQAAPPRPGAVRRPGTPRAPGSGTHAPGTQAPGAHDPGAQGAGAQGAGAQSPGAQPPGTQGGPATEESR